MTSFRHFTFDRRLPIRGTVIASTLAVASMGLALAPQTPPAQSTSSNRPDRPILVGPVTRAELKTPPFVEWFDGQYSRYQSPASAIESLRSSLRDVSIEVYFGTWCGDSRRQVPRLMRLLDGAGFDSERLTLVAVSDRSMEFKQAPGNPEAKRKIHRTPTVVVLREGVEIGRLVETPKVSLEADLLGILEGRGPEPKYGAEAWVHHLFSDLSPAEADRALQSGDPEVQKRSDPDSLWHYAEHDLLKNGRAREAKAVLDLHLRVNPGSAVGHILMSDALVALGRKAEAIEAIERALAMEPGNKRALGAAAKLRTP